MFIKSAFAEQATKGTVALGGSLWYALSQISWIGWLTGIYIVIQAAYLLRKWYHEEQEWKKGERNETRR